MSDCTGQCTWISDGSGGYTPHAACAAGCTCDRPDDDGSHRHREGVQVKMPCNEQANAVGGGHFAVRGAAGPPLHPQLQALLDGLAGEEADFDRDGFLRSVAQLLAVPMAQVRSSLKLKVWDEDGGDPGFAYHTSIPLHRDLAPGGHFFDIPYWNAADGAGVQRLRVAMIDWVGDELAVPDAGLVEILRKPTRSSWSRPKVCLELRYPGENLKEFEFGSDTVLRPWQANGFGNANVSVLASSLSRWFLVAVYRPTAD